MDRRVPMYILIMVKGFEIKIDFVFYCSGSRNLFKH